MWNINAFKNTFPHGEAQTLCMQHVNQTSLQVMVFFETFYHSNKN